MQIDAITRKSSLLAMLLLLIIVVATLVRSRLAPYDTELAVSSFFERNISYIISALLILAGGLVAGRVFLHSGLNKGFCTLPIPLYGVVLCGIFVSPDILEYCTTSLVFAFAVLLLMRSLNNPEEKDSIFFGSLFLGTIPLLLPQGVALVAILPLMIFYFALSFRQIVLMVTGYILPLLTASYIAWYGGAEFWSVAESLWTQISRPDTSLFETLPIVACVMGAYIVGLLLFGAIYGVVKPDKMFLLARVRHSLYIMLFLFVVTVAMLAIPSSNIAVLSIVAVPTTIILSLVLSLLPRTISTIAYWLLLGLTILHLFIE